ncbi:MAG: hypothetical protein LBL00_02325 [Endomicrobium sp.]|jgi:hypothetical protein|nr:hypothetical protein [Endomicrobium sp.]
MKRLGRLFSLLLCICLFLNACSTKLVSTNRLLPEKTPKLQEYDYTQFSHKNLLENIKFLNKKVKNTTYDAEKYDALINELTPLLEQYKALKALEVNHDKAIFTIQPNSKTTFKFKTYCLQSGKASPSANEQFVLRKDSPEIPLYKDIAIYTNSKEKITPSMKQHLFWNLRNDVKFEDLPTDQQAFLLKMDPTSYLKVNSVIKSQLTQHAKSQIPFYSQMADTIQMVKGKMYPYQEYARNVENLVSKLKLSNNVNPIKSDGYDIYTQTKSSGYSGTTITFINTTDFKQFVSWISFLDPLRKDVQPIGFDMPETYEDYEQYKDDIDNEFESLLGTILKVTGMGTEGEAKTIKDNPTRILDLIKADKAQKIATERTIKEFGYNGHNDESDAFRHAYWNAEMVKELGESFAEEIATNHEIASANTKEKEMDLHNNKIGRETAKKLIAQGITDSDSIVKEILANKELIVISPKKK